jgi:hypothetical protein
MKGCVDCLNKFSDSSKYMDLLFSIKFDGRPTCLNTDYKTLEKRIGIDLNTDFKMLLEQDRFFSKIDTGRFFICYKEKMLLYENFFPKIVMDSVEHLTIINKDAIILLQKISVNPIDSSENYVLFNCLEGDKRLIYCRDTLPKKRFEENHLFKLKENWYLYDNHKGKSKRYKRIIKRKQKKYDWN